MKIFIFAFLFVAYTGAIAGDTVTGQSSQSSGPSKSYACKTAKDDAERQARNKNAVVESFSACDCSENADKSMYCTVDAYIRRK